MDSGIIVELAFIALFYWMAFRALSTGRIRLNLGVFTRAEKAWCYWGFVSLYLVLGLMLMIKMMFKMLTTAA
ncbi:MAG: hypothetical protein ACYC67_07405 [Prosthecobacter sp.]|jgi:hypothetical protein